MVERHVANVNVVGSNPITRSLLCVTLSGPPFPGTGQRGGKGEATLALQDLRRQREAILAIAAGHGASNVRVFGSVARGEAGPDSDVDLLVELAADRSLLDQIALMQDLGDLLHRRVDVVSERGLNARIRQRVLENAVAL